MLQSQVTGETGHIQSWSFLLYGALLLSREGRVSEVRCDSQGSKSIPRTKRRYWYMQTSVSPKVLRRTPSSLLSFFSFFIKTIDFQVYVYF